MLTIHIDPLAIQPPDLPLDLPRELPQPAIRLPPPPWRMGHRSQITGSMQLVLSPEVATARRPIVALESTLVAHGLPWPDNLDVARELEDTVRAGGAVPATIAVVDGLVRIGLPDELLEQLAQGGSRFAKAGATDLAVHLARGTSAATTVSATAMLAAKAGIRVFATGGIGGVHRGDADDVSHDLPVLARTPIAVVSAGAKAILDLPRTLEHLETLGVLVIGYRTSELPAFYAQRSGLVLDHRVNNAVELAAIARCRWDELGGGGILVANPIPEAAAIAGLDAAIDAALAEAAAAGITGKRLTPFLLARLAVATGGASIRANRALAVHNAEVAAALAVALAA
ncbi:MAG TPA: pseudouridine-5'-phosphate glycosidase [Kofleriaceae bacterium]|nr:pseudouridine-5'-phosphate glycosidase [Kofleriaceae bacterium]